MEHVGPLSGIRVLELSIALTVHTSAPYSQTRVQMS